MYVTGRICMVVSVTCSGCEKREQIDVPIRSNGAETINRYDIEEALIDAGFVDAKIGWMHKDCAKERFKNQKGE